MPEATEGSIEIFDMTGKLQLHQEVAGIKKELSIVSFPPGIYSYRVTNTASRVMHSGLFTISK